LIGKSVKSDSKKTRGYSSTSSMSISSLKDGYERADRTSLSSEKVMRKKRILIKAPDGSYKYAKKFGDNDSCVEVK